MTEPRLYLDTPLAAGAQIALDKADAHYLINVMRRKPGDRVRLFNGREGEWRAEVSAADRKGGVLTVTEALRQQTASPDLWLLFAPVKKAKTDLIVEKAVELGVSVLQPVSTRRTIADRIKAERFEAIAKEAAEQTERLDLPEIRPLSPLDRALQDWPAGRLLYFADEAGDDPDAAWGGETGRARPMGAQLAADGPGPGAVLTGPEGGFSPEEGDRLRALAFVRPVSLGPRILRAETAVIAALTLWQSHCGDWGGDQDRP